MEAKRHRAIALADSRLLSAQSKALAEKSRALADRSEKLANWGIAFAVLAFLINALNLLHKMGLI